MVYKFKATHFHRIDEENGQMHYWDACDCGCQNYKGDVNAGDILIGNNIFLSGHLKNILIYADQIHTGRAHSAPILDNVKIILMTHEEMDKIDVNTFGN